PLPADKPPCPRCVVVAQVLANARQCMANLHSQVAQALRLPDAGQFQQLRGVERTPAHHDLARGAGLTRGAPEAVADTDATLAVEHNALGQRARLDVQVRAPADWVEIAAGRAHAATVGDRRLAHGDPVLASSVVVGVVRDPDLTGRLDQRDI